MRIGGAEVEISPDLTGFRPALRSGVAAASAGVKVTINVDYDRSTIGRLTKEMGVAKSQASLLKVGVEGIKWAGMAAGATAAATSLVSMGGAAVGVVGALAPLAGLAATLPGILGGVGAGFGVVKLATAGVGDALKAGRLGSKEFAEALKELPAAARPFTVFLAGLRPKLDELTRVAQTGFLPALQRGIQAAVTTYFPMFRTALKGAADIMGSLVDQGARLITSGPFRADVKAILAANNVNLARFGQIGIDVLDTLRHLTASAIPLTTWLVTLFQKWAEGAKRGIELARQTGALAAFFDRTRQAASSLFAILGNVGSALFATIGAATPLGTTVLKNIENATRKLREFTRSDAGQAALRKFFDDLRPVLTATGEILKGAAGAMLAFLGRVKEGAQLAARFGATHPQVAQVVGQFLALAALAKFTGVAGLVKTIAPLLVAAGPIGLIVGAIAAVGVAGYLAYTKVKPFRDAVDGLGREVRAVLAPVLSNLRDVIVGQVIPAIQKALPFVRDQLVAGIKEVTRAIKDNRPQLQQLGNLLVTVGGWVATKLIPFLIQLYALHLRTLMGQLAATIRVVGAVITAFHAWWVAMTTTIRNVTGLVSSLKTKFEEMRRSAQEKVDAIIRFFRELPGRARSAFLSGVGSLVASGRAKFEEIRVAASQKAAAIVQLMRELPGRARSGFLSAAGSLVSSVASKFAEIRDRAKGPLNSLIDLINKFIGLVNKLPGVDFSPIGHLNSGGPVQGIPGYGTKFLRSGGRVPGGGPNRDTVPAMLSPGEFVIQRPAAQALGLQLLAALNQSHRTDIAGDPSGMIVRRKTGGIIPRVQQRIRGWNPLPYIFGAAGPGGFDCSGITSAAYGMLTGRGGGSGQRYFTTASVGGGQGFKRGRGTYTIGVTRDPSDGVGHMAGNLAGLAFEARSTRTGIFVGPSARSVNSFREQWYLPQAGSGFVGGGSGKGGLGGIARAALNAILSPARRGVNALGGAGIGGAIAKQIGNQALDKLIKTIEDGVGIFHGGGKVHRDQLAYLERGERVLSAAQERARVRGWDGAAAGGLTIAVDARGSTNPAEVEAAARRGAQLGAAAALGTYRQARVVRPRR